MENASVNTFAARAKKGAVLAIAGAMAMGLAAAPAYANPDTITDPNGENTSTHGVTLEFKQHESVATVYSVDVTWGDLEGVYTSSSDDTWNPEDHTYTTSSNGAYSGFDGAAVTVTNHSNAPVKVKSSYQAESGAEGITVKFSEAEKQLDTAVGTTHDDAPKVEMAMSIEGNASNLLSQVSGAKKIGTATITVEAVR